MDCLVAHWEHSWAERYYIRNIGSCSILSPSCRQVVILEFLFPSLRIRAIAKGWHWIVLEPSSWRHHVFLSSLWLTTWDWVDNSCGISWRFDLWLCQQSRRTTEICVVGWRNTQEVNRCHEGKQLRDLGRKINRNTGRVSVGRMMHSTDTLSVATHICRSEILVYLNPFICQPDTLHWGKQGSVILQTYPRANLVKGFSCLWISSYSLTGQWKQR